MADVCIGCGKPFSGFSNSFRMKSSEINKLRDKGIDFPYDICPACFDAHREKAEAEHAGNLIESAAIARIFVNTLAPPKGYSPMGMLSAHVVLHTSFLVAQLRDDERPKTDGDYMTDAEKACIEKLKARAYAMGADAVVGLRTTCTEAPREDSIHKRNTILLVCMIGTAIKKTEEEKPKARRSPASPKAKPNRRRRGP